MSKGWEEIHEALVAIGRKRAGMDAEEARWLLAAKRTRVWERLGLGSMVEYCDRVLGYRPRLAIDKLRVAEALESLPALAGELAAGQLSWSAVRELSRVAIADTEAAWIDAARGKTVREVEAMISGRRCGDGPGDPAEPGARRHVLRLEVSATTFAAFREARQRIEAQVGHSLDDDAAVGMMAHELLASSDHISERASSTSATTAGRSSADCESRSTQAGGRAAYQIAMTVCERCDRGFRDGGGEVFEVEPAEVAAARCDAQAIGRLDAGRPERASQRVPPATRRLVRRRQHGKCAVPGCRSARHLELHHLDLRSEGGGHDPSRLVMLCWAHHAAFHRGRLLIEGRAPDGLRFLHPDRTAYGVMPDPAEVDRRAGALSGLVAMGVREGDARRALAEVPGGGSLESLLRDALQVLARTTYRHVSRASEAAPRWCHVGGWGGPPACVSQER